MIFQKAVLAQTDEIMGLIDEAKAFFRACHVDQWQDGYPEKENIVQDIQDEDAYILQEGSEIIGYCCIDFDKEPAYDTLKEGKWLNDEPYIVIHRMTVANRCKEKGLAKQLFAHAEALAKEHGVYNIRVDTDEENAIMKHIIDSLGFVCCGGIWFANSDKIAFQKVLNK